MKKCNRCGQVKNWNGDDPKCPFQSSEIFGENWNCGIINQIRDLCDRAEEGTDHRLHYQFCEDQKYAVIKTDEIETDEGEYIGLCLWVTWYKRRGATGDMYLLSESEARRPTYDELTLIINHYKV